MLHAYKDCSYNFSASVILVDLVLNETLLVRQLLTALLWALRALLWTLRALLWTLRALLWTLRVLL